MSLSTALSIADKLIALLGRLIPRAKPKSPAFEAIKITPEKRPIDPWEKKR